MSIKQKLHIFYFCILILLNVLNIYLQNNLFEKVYALFALVYCIYCIFFFKLNFFLKIYIFFYFLLLFKGFLYGNFIPYLLYDIFSFSAPFIILNRNKFNFFDYYFKLIPLIGVYLNILGIIFALIHVVQHGLFFSSLDLGRGLDDADVLIMSPKSYIYISFFIYPLSSYVINKKHLFTYNISMILFILFSLAMGSRGTTSVGLLIFLLTNLNNIKSNSKYLLLKKYFKYFIVLVVLIFLINKIPIINASVKYLEYRFFEETESLGSERTEEAVAVLSNISYNELFFGKGFGGSNSYWIFENIPNGVNNVHYGWLFIILKGGIFLLIFLYGSIVFSLFKMITTKRLRPYSFVLFAFLLMEFTHQNTGNFMIMCFIYISMAPSFSNDIIKNKHILN